MASLNHLSICSFCFHIVIALVLGGLHYKSPFLTVCVIGDDITATVY